MASGDTFQLKDVQTYIGEELMNVYYYQQIEGGDGAEELAAAWVADVLPSIQAIQNNGLVHDRLDILNYQDDEDFWTETLGSTFDGDVSGEALPRFNAWAYRINRATRLVKNGSKRYAGVSENWQSGGVPGGTGVVEALEALAVTLGERLSDVNGNSWDLRIGSFAGGIAIPAPYEISGVTFIGISTQNSRKR